MAFKTFSHNFFDRTFKTPSKQTNNMASLLFLLVSLVLLWCPTTSGRRVVIRDRYQAIRWATGSVPNNTAVRMFRQTNSSACMLTGMYWSPGDSYICRIIIESGYWKLQTSGRSGNQECFDFDTGSSRSSYDYNSALLVPPNQVTPQNRVSTNSSALGGEMNDTKLALSAEHVMTSGQVLSREHVAIDRSTNVQMVRDTSDSMCFMT